MPAYALTVKLGQLLDKALFALNDNGDRTQDALQDVMTHIGALRSSNSESSEQAFQLGAAELLQALLVRVIERKDGNRALNFVRRRKYVRDMLHILAASQRAVLPGIIAARLGAQPSAIAALLKEAEELGLVAKVDNAMADGRNRPRTLTNAGRAALTTVKPDWPISSLPQANRRAFTQIERLKGNGLSMRNSASPALVLSAVEGFIVSHAMEAPQRGYMDVMDVLDHQIRPAQVGVGVLQNRRTYQTRRFRGAP